MNCGRRGGGGHGVVVIVVVMLMDGWRDFGGGGALHCGIIYT